MDLYQEHVNQKLKTGENWHKYERRGHHHDSVRSPQSWAASQRHLKRTHYSGPCVPVRDSGCSLPFPDHILTEDDAGWGFLLEEADAEDFLSLYDDLDLAFGLPRYRRHMPRLPQSTAMKLGSRGRRKFGPKRKRCRKPDKDNLYSLLSVMKLLVLKGYPLSSVIDAFRVPVAGGMVAYCGHRETISQGELDSMGKIDYRNISKGSRALSRRSLELDGLWNKLPWFAKGMLDNGSFDLLNRVGSRTVERYGLDDPDVWDRLPLGVKVYFACVDTYSEHRVEMVREIFSHMHVPFSQNGRGMQFLIDSGYLPRPPEPEPPKAKAAALGLPP